MTITDAPTTDRLPFHLRGNFAPVVDEVTATKLTVRGQIPRELSGVYMRNGANPLSGKSAHWFAGDGMIHGIRLDGGQAQWYRNRYVKTRALDGAAQMDNMGNIDRTVGVANTHIVSHAGKIMALVESSFPTLMTAECETIGTHDFGGKLNTAMTAHPKICAETGEMHFFGYGYFAPFLTYHRCDAAGNLIQTEEIAAHGATMIHDFAMSRNHVIFMDLPVIFDLDLAVTGGMPYHWDDDYESRFGIMPRGGHGADTKWFSINPCYVFHPMNAFDDGDEVVVDVARYPEMWRGNADAFNVASLWRFRFNMVTGAVSEQQLDDRQVEFPRVHDGRIGLDHRFGYCAVTTDPSLPANERPSDGKSVKYDLHTGQSWEFSFGAGRMPGEVVFVPAADAKAEDDGYLMTYVYDNTTNSSDFVVLDASDPSAAPVAVVELPQRVPFGFHGSWIADQEVSAIGSWIADQ